MVAPGLYNPLMSVTTEINIACLYRRGRGSDQWVRVFPGQTSSEGDTCEVCDEPVTIDFERNRWSCYGICDGTGEEYDMQLHQSDVRIS